MSENETVTVTLTRREWRALFDAILRDLREDREADFIGMLRAAASLRAAGHQGEPPIAIDDGPRPS